MSQLGSRVLSFWQALKANASKHETSLLEVTSIRQTLTDIAGPVKLLADHDEKLSRENQVLIDKIKVSIYEAVTTVWCVVN